MKTLITDCTRAKAGDIEKMVDNAEEVTFKELAGQCDLTPFHDRYKDTPDLSLENDYAVSFYKSTYQGKPCYYVVHSMIEYVFQ